MTILSSLILESAVYITGSKTSASVPLFPSPGGRQLEDPLSDKVQFSTAWSSGLNAHPTSKIQSKCLISKISKPQT